MGYEFDRDTAVTRLAEGCYAGEISPLWNVGDKPNGGYLLAIALRAAAAEMPLPDPFTSTAHYLRAPTPGPVTLDVERIRAGRSHATAMVSLSQDGTECVRVLTTFGDLGGLAGLTAVRGEPPALPPPEEALTGKALLPDGMSVAIAERFEIAFSHDTVGWARGAPTGVADVRACMRFVDGRDFDPLSLTLVTDALPPPVFDLGVAGWVPTIELTAHVRARPSPGWVRVAVSTRFVQGGYLEEDAEVWDSAGTLVAQSRQLARLTGGAAAPQ